MGKSIPKETKLALVKENTIFFDKESHAKSLVEGLARLCRDKTELTGKLETARLVVNALRQKGITSFFAAEYGKVFDDPAKACSARDSLIARFRGEHALDEKQAGKMADCIIFAVAKKQDINLIQRLADICSRALAIGVPFTVTADVAYYNSADVPVEKFATRCIETGSKQKRPVTVSVEELVQKLAETTVPHESVLRKKRKEGYRKGVREVVEAMNEFGAKKL